MSLPQQRSAPSLIATAPHAEGERSDKDLLVAARSDPRDFAPLFMRYWTPVLRYCRYRLGNMDDAEDAASQIFVDAYAALSRFQDRGREGAFRSWLFTIAHHEVVNRHRYRTRHAARSLDAAVDLPDPEAGPEHVGVIAGDMARISPLLNGLSARPREVVELRLAGLNDREIAEILGVSQAAVRQAQSRAVSALRHRLGLDTGDTDV